MTIESLRILWWIVMCFWAGRDIGKTVDIQYREPEGKSVFVTIPGQHRWLFHFNSGSHNKVVREGVLVQVLGYLFCAIECILFILSINNSAGFIIQIADIVFIAFILVAGLGIIFPLHFRYEHNIMTTFECDRITRYMRMLTIYPKRRCKVVSRISGDTFEITLGRFGHKRYRARAEHPDGISLSDRYYAIHSYEKGAPYWTIRTN